MPASAKVKMMISKVCSATATPLRNSIVTSVAINAAISAKSTIDPIPPPRSWAMVTILPVYLRVQHRPHLGGELRGRERLLKKRRLPRHDLAMNVIRPGVPADEEDRQRRVGGSKAIDSLRARQAGGQDIGDHQMNVARMLLCDANRLVALAGDEDRIAVSLERRSRHAQDARIVFEEQDRF